MSDRVIYQSESISEFQKWLHSPFPGSTLDPAYSYDDPKISWESTSLEEIIPIFVESEVTFELNPERDLLLYTTLIVQTPEIVSSSPDILVAWSDNLFHNYIQEITLMSGDQILTSMDSKFFDANIQLIPTRTGARQRDQYLECIGNGLLNRFQSRIPSKEITFPVPWSWTRERSPPLPIMLMNSLPLTIKITLNSLENLIRVVERRSGNEVLRKYQPSDPITVGTFSNLRMICRYGKVTPAEFRLQRSVNRYLYLDFIEKFEIPVDSTGVVDQSIRVNGPSRALIVMAENLESSSVNNLSNYSTNSEDAYLGYGPISVLEGLSGSIFSESETYWNGLSSPERPGYYLLAFSPHLARYRDVGISEEAFIRAELVSPNYELHIRSYGYRIWSLINGFPSLVTSSGFPSLVT